MEKKKYTNIIGTVTLIYVFFLTPSVIHAATIGFSPTTLSRTVGSTFSVAVNVSSADKAMNAASGVVSFPTDKLEVVGLSKTGSVVNLWVQEPTFSNVQGVVNFEGISLNPGYTGGSGKIITITFRTKSAGQADIKFSSSSVLANDGIGTNILTGFGNATVSIQAIPPRQEGIDINKDTKKIYTEIVETKEKTPLETPVITYYQEEVESGDFIKIQGIANPGVDVKIKILRAGESIQQKTVRSTGSGNFVIVVDPISEQGVYTFVAQAIDEAGNMSNETSPFTVIVQQKWLNQVLKSILSYLSLTLLLLLALIGVIMTAVFLWYRLVAATRRMKKKNREVEKMLEKSFNILRKDIAEHIVRLRDAKSKRELSSEEIVFLERFEDELAEAKDIVVKEVQSKAKR